MQQWLFAKGLHVPQKLTPRAQNRYHHLPRTFQNATMLFPKLLRYASQREANIDHACYDYP